MCSQVTTGDDHVPTLLPPTGQTWNFQHILVINRTGSSFLLQIIHLLLYYSFPRVSLNSGLLSGGSPVVCVAQTVRKLCYWSTCILTLTEIVRVSSVSADFFFFFWDATLPPNVLMSSSSLLIYLAAVWIRDTNATCVEYFDLFQKKHVMEVTHDSAEKKCEGGRNAECVCGKWKLMMNRFMLVKRRIFPLLLFSWD